MSAAFDITDEVVVAGSFPESNPFGLVVNGEKNSMLLQLSNQGSNNYTLVSAAASYHDPANNWKLMKNVSTLKYNVPLMSGANFSAPFNFHSEFRPQELGLTVWVDVKDGTELHRITAFNQTVSVVEPASSWFDPQLLLLWLILGTAILGGAYAAYQTFFGSPHGKKKRSGTKRAVVPADQKEQSYPTVKPYEEEWIPEQHLKSRTAKLRRKTDGGGASSGGEEVTSGGEATSGGEQSATEGKTTRRRKSKK